MVSQSSNNKTTDKDVVVSLEDADSRLFHRSLIKDLGSFGTQVKIFNYDIRSLKTEKDEHLVIVINNDTWISSVDGEYLEYPILPAKEDEVVQAMVIDRPGKDTYKFETAMGKTIELDCRQYLIPNQVLTLVKGPSTGHIYRINGHNNPVKGDNLDFKISSSDARGSMELLMDRKFRIIAPGLELLLRDRLAYHFLQNRLATFYGKYNPSDYFEGYCDEKDYIKGMNKKCFTEFKEWILSKLKHSCKFVSDIVMGSVADLYINGKDNPSDRLKSVLVKFKDVLDGVDLRLVSEKIFYRIAYII